MPTPEMVEGRCWSEWPTPGPTERQIHFSYRGGGVCFDEIFLSDRRDADVFIRLNNLGPWRQLAWNATTCWTYKDDGTIPIVKPTQLTGPILVCVKIQKGVFYDLAGMWFFPPAKAPIGVVIP